MQPAEFLQQKKVYFVGSPTDDTVLVAIRPHYQEQIKTLYWWDTTKERAKVVKSIRVDETPVLRVVDVQDTSYIFVPLSLPFYNNMVKNKLPGKREFSSEEEMVKAFEETTNPYRSLEKP